MSRDSRNSVQFSAETITKKPAWLQRQLAQFIKPNGTPTPAHRLPRPESEPPLLDGPLRPPSGKAAYTGRVRISVTSVRKRLIDPDNLCPKYFIDCCRYAGLVRDDTPEQVEIVTTQRRILEGEKEHTEILIEPIP